MALALDVEIPKGDSTTRKRKDPQADLRKIRFSALFDGIEIEDQGRLAVTALAQGGGIWSKGIEAGLVLPTRAIMQDLQGFLAGDVQY